MLGTSVISAKMAETINVPFGCQTHADPRNHVLDGRQYRTNSFAAMAGDKTAMRHFATLLWTLVCLRELYVGMAHGVYVIGTQ